MESCVRPPSRKIPRSKTCRVANRSYYGNDRGSGKLTLQCGFGLAAPKLGCLHRVAHQHGDGEFADATWNWGTGSGHAGDAGVTVSNDGASLFGELLFSLLVSLEKSFEEYWVGDLIDSDIEDSCTGLDELGGNEARASDGGYKDVSPAADRRQSTCPRVTDGDSGVGIGEQHGQRLTDNVTATDDNRLLAFDGDIGAAENFHASSGSAGDKARALSTEVANVDRVKSINILFGRDGKENALGIDVRRQGKLNKNAINLIAIIELLDQGDKFLGGRGLRRGDQFAEYA